MEMVRIAVAKKMGTQYVGHLDFCRAIERALRRAKLPVAQSEGFNPHMKLSFGPALGVGVASQAEYIDVELSDIVSETEFGKRLADQLPPGLAFVAAATVQSRTSLAAALNIADYQADAAVPLEVGVFERAGSSVAAFLAEESVWHVRRTPKGEKTLDIKQYLMGELLLKQEAAERIRIDFRLRMTATGAIKPQELLAVLVGQFGFPAGAVSFTRTGLWHDTGAGLKAAFDI